MHTSLPWKIEPKKRVIESNGVSLEILDYGSLLVKELLFMKKLPDEMLGNERVQTFVAFCLRFRYGLSEDMTDEEVIGGMPIDLLAKIFSFLVYGDENQVSVEVKSASKKLPEKQTGAESTGNSSSTTQITLISPTPETTSDALSTSSLGLSGLSVKTS